MKNCDDKKVMPSRRLKNQISKIKKKNDKRMICRMDEFSNKNFPRDSENTCVCQSNPSHLTVFWDLIPNINCVQTLDIGEQLLEFQFFVVCELVFGHQF